MTLLASLLEVPALRVLLVADAQRLRNTNFRLCLLVRFRLRLHERHEVARVVLRHSVVDFAWRLAHQRAHTLMHDHQVAVVYVTIWEMLAACRHILLVLAHARQWMRRLHYV